MTPFRAARLRTSLAAVACVVASALAPPARADDTWRSTEFSAGITSGCSITDITAGSDGNLWFAEYANQAIGRITPLGKATEFALPNDPDAGPYGFPSGIAAGPDGALWYLRRSGRVGRITPQGEISEFGDGITGFTMNVTTAELPNGIAAGPDGALWFTEPDGVIGRITTDGSVTEYRDGITTYIGSTLGTLAGIASGADGAMWFTDPQGAIGRITTAGAVTEFTEGISPGAVPTEIARGPDGNMWFTELYGGRVGRITPGGSVTEFSKGIAPNAAPSGITLGPDGNLWFAERVGRVGRITPQGTVTQFAAGTNSNPTAITKGPDAAVWYATSDRVGRLARRSVTIDRTAPRVRLGTLRGRRLSITSSETAVLTARSGKKRLRISLRAGASKITLPSWVVTAGRKGLQLTATDRAGNARRVVLRVK